MKITHPMLVKAKACAGPRAEFKRLFGKSVEVTEALCVEHVQVFDWGGAAEHLLAPAARAAYDEATATAWATYNAAIAPARAAYNAATATARAALNKATAMAWAAYLKATAPAWATYLEATAPAWATYREARARAFAQAFNSTENQS
jgi:hypothetical protein